jgi:putative SOS response-associated peptidase YedK
MQPVHDGMPLVVPIEDWDTWLDPMPSTDEVLLPLLKPFAPDLMQLWPVANAAGRVSNQEEGLIRPIIASSL